MKRNFLIFTTIMMLFSYKASQGEAATMPFVWTVEVVSAQGLKNTDLAFNGLSDPFVDIYVRVSGMNNYNAKTPVIYDTLNPQWNYSVKHSYPINKKPFDISFTVWDQDKMGKRFLGVARLNHPVAGQEYTLNLYRRRLLNTPTEPGKFLMPGRIKVKVSSKAPSARVPNVVGKTYIDAGNILKNNGFVPGRQGSVIIHNEDSVGKVVSQNPVGGNEASLGSMVRYYIGRLPTYIVPNEIGCSFSRARKLLSHFKNVKITYRVPSADIPRDKWMTVVDQSPKPPHAPITDKAQIDLVVLRPPEDFKIIIPDVVGSSPSDAARLLRDAQAPSIQWKKERTADESKNNIVVGQSPSAGEEIPWTENSPILVTVAWYANGKSLYAAKPTQINTPFEVTFDKPNISEYRLVKIDKPGYLILKNNQCPDNITPRSSYYKEGKGWEEVNTNYYMPSAQRVTPGNWVVKISPEMSESTSEKSCQFELNFIEEFDPAEPNDTLEQAVEITPDAEAILGFMGAYDNDYYSFEIKTPGYLEVSFKELPSELIDRKTEQGLLIKFSLYNEQKEDIGSYYLPSAVFLSPGKYYIDISSGEQLWNRLRYKFTLQFHEVRDVGEPNDTKEMAYEVDVGKTIPVAYSINDTDYYRIKSDKPGYAVLSHDINIPFDVNLYRYDKEGHEVGPIYLPAAVRIEGEQLVSLSAVSEGTGYLVDPPAHLQIGFISGQEDPYEPNDSPEEATPIKLNQTIKGLLMPRRENDNYSFAVKKAGEIFFDLIKPEGKDIPIKGKLLSFDGATVIVDDLYLPCSADIKEPGQYILQFGQEPGLERLCEKQYQLTIRDGKKEKAGDNRTPQDRYGKNDDSQCISFAQEAYQFLLKKNYEDAKKLYLQALECLPDNEVIWNDYAVSCFKLQEEDTAEKALRKAIELNRQYALAYRNLAFVLWKKNKYALARDMSVQAVELDPSDENLRYAAHAYILLSEQQKGEEKMGSLKKSAEYYKKIKVLSNNSKKNLNAIQKILGQD